jgi:transposase-like protein
MGTWADGKTAMGIRNNPFAPGVDALNDSDFKLLRHAVAQRRCKEKVGFGTYAELVDGYRSDRPCPLCGSKHHIKNGRTPAGLQRFECKACASEYSALTGTIFEHSKKDLADWVNFVTMMCHNVQVEAAADMCEISHKTAFEWRHRVFATVTDYQERTMLKKRVWIDETYVEDSALIGQPDWRPKRGLSKNKICIAVAIDVFKNPYAVICGHGKPSAKRIKEALQGHIQEGSTIVHDMEKSHKSLVKSVKGIDEPYRADTKDPAYLEAMQMVNNLCAWLKYYLRRFPGMKQDNLQDYLNWFVYLFRVTRDKEKWPKVERVLRHLAMSKTTFRSIWA